MDGELARMGEKKCLKISVAKPVGMRRYNRVSRCELKTFGSGQVPMAGPRVHDNKAPISKLGGKFLDFSRKIYLEIKVYITNLQHV
jgi:hypothetical protein